MVGKNSSQDEGKRHEAAEQQGRQVGAATRQLHKGR